MENLLEQARKKYPPGTIVKTLYGGKGPYTIDGPPKFLDERDGRHRVVMHVMEPTDTNDGTIAVHGDKSWAEILSTTFNPEIY